MAPLLLQQPDFILLKELLAQIEAKGVKLVYPTLHVGLGTFRPVSVDNLDDHEMHSESYTLSEEAAATLREVKAKGHRVIAVGTTSIRTLETIEISSRRHSS